MIDEKILKDVAGKFYIPPKPEILVAIQEQANAADPDVGKMVRLVSQDVALSAAVLRTLNSPAYGFAMKIDNIQQAAMLLGIKGISTLATGFLLSKAYVGKKACISLERFWDESQQTGALCYFIGDKTSLKSYVPLESLYTLGLFHNAGIAAFAIRFPDYREVLEAANRQPEVMLSDLENERYRTSHAIVSYYLARSWGLPDNLCQLILEHDNPSFLRSSAADDSKMAWACLALVRTIQSHIRYGWDTPYWPLVESQVYELLGIGRSDHLDFREDAEELLHG
ncbi:MAG: HDOD domain-containing protein [Gammaproteobacteria bacterium]|nr:MAG: HDOD domain-containing protein [Gammaproteobacteria bacterium]